MTSDLIFMQDWSKLLWVMGHR